MSMPAHKMHTKWRLAQLETPVEIAALPSDRYDESLHNKGANMINVDLCVNHSLQSSEFDDRHEEEEEEEEEGAV